jgi:hypothetical protein
MVGNPRKRRVATRVPLSVIMCNEPKPICPRKLVGKMMVDETTTGLPGRSDGREYRLRWVRATALSVPARQTETAQPPVLKTSSVRSE